MRETRFIHVADLHLGAPFRGMSERFPEFEDRFLRAREKALERLAVFALREKVSFVLCAGDIFDAANVPLRAYLCWERLARTLKEGGIALFAVRGNHDPFGEDSLIGAHVFPADRVECVRDIPGAAIYGISYAQAAETRNLAALFPEHNDPDRFGIALLHGNVGGQSGVEPYAPATLGELRAHGMDYWALGHVHTGKVLSESRPAVVYPGSIQGGNPNETGPHGAVLTILRENAVPEIRFEAFSDVNFETCRFSAEQIHSLREIAPLLCSAAREIQEKSGGVLTAVRLTLPGFLRRELEESGESDPVRLFQETTAREFPEVLWESVHFVFPEPERTATGTSANALIGDLLSYAAEADPRSLLQEELPALRRTDRICGAFDDEQLKVLQQEACAELQERLSGKSSR